MGIGKSNKFQSDTVEYSTPLCLFLPLAAQFNLKQDVCASDSNHKLPKYWTKTDNALTKDWSENFWMNPPFNRELKKWVLKAAEESKKNNVTGVCLVPVRSNTLWWMQVTEIAEIRFIIGEVNFSNLDRGLWMPMCILIFGPYAKVGKFSFINYKQIRKKSDDTDLV